MPAPDRPVLHAVTSFEGGVGGIERPWTLSAPMSAAHPGPPPAPDLSTLAHPATGSGDLANLPDLADLAVIGAWQQVRKAMSAVDSRLACTLSAADAPAAAVHEALAAVAAAPRQMLPMSELAAVLGLTTGGATKLVDRLVAAGFARRQHSSTDRRVVFAALTDDGTAHERVSTAQYAQQLNIELSVLGPVRLAQLQDIAAVLQEWTRNDDDTDHEPAVSTQRAEPTDAGEPPERASSTRLRLTAQSSLKDVVMGHPRLRRDDRRPDRQAADRQARHQGTESDDARESGRG